MRARIRHWRTARRLSPTSAGYVLPLTVLVTLIVLSRLILTTGALFPADECEAVLFWLSGWEEGRSLLHLTGAVSTAAVGAWGVWIIGRADVTVKVGSGLVLLVWLTAFDRQLAALFPHKPHPLASWSERILPPPQFEDQRSYEFTDGFGRIERIRDDDLSELMARDPLAWRSTDELYGTVDEASRRITIDASLARPVWTTGRTAPSYHQMEALRACIAYNARAQARYKARLAVGEVPLLFYEFEYEPYMPYWQVVYQIPPHVDDGRFTLEPPVY